MSCKTGINNAKSLEKEDTILSRSTTSDYSKSTNQMPGYVFSELKKFVKNFDLVCVSLLKNLEREAARTERQVAMSAADAITAMPTAC